MRSCVGLKSQDLEKLPICCVFWKSDPLLGNFHNSVRKVFIATPIVVSHSNFVKFAEGNSAKSCVTYLTKKFSPGSPALASPLIAPKICRGQLPTMYSERSRFHPNRFTFGGVISERVNIVRARCKVNPIFGWSLASSRIINLSSNTRHAMAWVYRRRHTCNVVRGWLSAIMILTGQQLRLLRWKYKLHLFIYLNYYIRTHLMCRPTLLFLPSTSKDICENFLTTLRYVRYIPTLRERGN